jgi:DNA-binding XRE family transcriptional regulator
MNKFKADRLKLGITQKQLAPILGVSIRTIQQYEQGIYKPSKAVSMLLEMELKK